MLKLEVWLQVKMMKMSVVRKCDVLALNLILRQLDEDITIRQITITYTFKVVHNHT